MKHHLSTQIWKCYQIFSKFNPNLNKWLILQSMILITSRVCVALFTLALTYFINKRVNLSIWEFVTLSVMSFYSINRMMEWALSALHGRIHSTIILPSAFNFIDSIIYMMLNHREQININKNPVELASLLNKKTEARGFLGFLFNHIATPMVELIVCAILVINIGFGWLGFLLIPVCLFHLFLGMQLIPKIKQRLLIVMNLNAKTSGMFSTSLEKASLAESFGTTHLLIEHLKKLTQDENNAHRKTMALSDAMSSLLSLPLAIFSCLFFYYGAQYVLKGYASYGAFAAFIGIIMNSFSQLKNMSFALDGLNQSLSALTTHMDIYEKCKNLKAKQPIKITQENFQTLRLKNFTVLIDKKPLLSLNLQLHQKDKVFIVGKSGIGKSSLIKALLNYQEYEGEKQLNNETFTNEYSIFSWLPQNYHSIEGSVYFNLKLGNPNATEEQMWEVLKNVHLLERVKNLGGLHANLTHQGENLSGGENQRLSLARSLLSENPVLLLDEPSSALDMSTEKSIFQTVMHSPKTAMVVVHRLRAIPKNAIVLYIEDKNTMTLLPLTKMLSENASFKSLYETQHD